MLKVQGAIGDDGIPVEVSVDARILKVVKKIHKLKKQSFDWVGIVSGLPGKGKSFYAISTLAPLLTKRMDQIFIEFTTPAFISKCADVNTPNDSTVILDEGYDGMNSGNVARSEFKEMMNLLMLVRQKNLNIIIVIQDFFSLAKTIAIFRSNTLFHVITNKKGKRGTVLTFSRKKKKMLYILGKKYLNYGAVRGFVSQFNKNSHLMPKNYEKRKADHLISQNKDLRGETLGRGSISSRVIDQGILNLTKLQHNQKSIARILGIGLTTLTDHWKAMKLRGEVPEEYLNRYSFRHKLPITPTNTGTGTRKSEKSEPNTILTYPKNKTDDVIEAEGENNI